MFISLLIQLSTGWVFSHARLQTHHYRLPNNPLRTEIVAYPIDYLYSSASDNSGEKGLVEIEFV